MLSRPMSAVVEDVVTGQIGAIIPARGVSRVEAGSIVGDDIRTGSVSRGEAIPPAPPVSGRAQDPPLRDRVRVPPLKVRGGRGSYAVTPSVPLTLRGKLRDEVATSRRDGTRDDSRGGFVGTRDVRREWQRNLDIGISAI